MTDGPKRTASQELTAVIPRDHLPPPSGHLIATLDLDPEHPETRDLVSRVASDDDWHTTPTLVPCPAGCRTCNCCGGRGMVTSEEAAEWRIQQAEAKGVADDE